MTWESSGFGSAVSLAWYRFAWPTEFNELCNELEIETEPGDLVTIGCCFRALSRGRCDVLKRAAICCRGVHLIVQLERIRFREILV
jgi:hypothetical protein